MFIGPVIKYNKNVSLVSFILVWQMFFKAYTAYNHQMMDAKLDNSQTFATGYYIMTRQL